MRLVRKWSAIVAVSLSWIAAGPYAGPRAQEKTAPAVDPSLGPYASNADSAQLSDGRTIHLVCMGTGSPVVILTAGANDWGIVWNKVQPAVARKTRVCTWDRAGFGLSTPSEHRQIVENRTDDLQAALTIGGIAGPYVLVGHSMGAHETLMLTDRMPTKVVGMVLVDPLFPDSFSILGRVAPGFIGWVRTYSTSDVPRYHACVMGLRAGDVGYGKPDPNGCTKIPRSPTLPLEVRAALDRVQIDAGPRVLAAWYETQISYLTSSFSEEDAKATINLNRNYGSMPLVVLTAGEDGTPPPDLPDSIKAELPKQAAEWRRSHRALAALSARGANRIVPDSSHYIHQIKPQVVINAIDEVIDTARAERH